MRSAFKTKVLLFNGSNDARKPFHKSSNSIVGDLNYRKRQGGEDYKIEAPPLAVERLIRDKLEGRIAGSTSHGELLRLFRHFDKDGSGEIDVHEFKKMMAAFNVKLTNTAAKEMFKRYDKTNDGTIGYEEFKSQVMGEDLFKQPHACPVKFNGDNDVDYMVKGGGRGLEITNIDWHNGKVDAKPSLVEKVLRQKLFERTGAASNHELRRAWNLIDKDGSKRIDQNELDHMLKSFNISLSRRKLKELFSRYDVNGDGAIDQAEFENGVLNGRFPKRQNRARQFAGFEDLDPRPPTTRGKVSRALRNGGITGVDFTGHVSTKTKAEDIERTLRLKLRERSDGRSCHELHRVWQQYDKDFDHRVDINEFKQILVAFNIHPADALLRSLFQRYDSNDDGLIERAEFENAILNGILPKSKNPNRAQTSQGFSRPAPSGRSNVSTIDLALDQERSLLEQHAKVTIGLLQQAKEANRRVLKLQGGGFSQRSRSSLSGRPMTVPGMLSGKRTGARMQMLNLQKAQGL